MLKIKKVKKEIEVDVVEGVYCNMCGDLCPEEWVSIHKCWGYFSKKDMIEQRAEICESCWDIITDQFLIPIAEHDHLDPPDPDVPDDVNCDAGWHDEESDEEFHREQNDGID